jgi:hypothetical protein
MITNLLHLLALPLRKTLCVSERSEEYILCVQMMDGQGEPAATTLVPFSPS